jgi:haloalkane dehalogenase
MSDSSKPFAPKKFLEIKGRCMACIDEGQGAPIVFQHGNPTSSYLWRNVMPACRGLGRLIACDLIGMGDSDKLLDSGPDRYTYAEQRDFLFAFWEELKLGNDVIFVLHDWGSALGFDWANQHRDRVQGLAYMEAIVMPMAWSEFPESARTTFRALRSPDGDEMVLRDNLFVERLLPRMVMRQLSDTEMDHYRRPFANPGEDRRPTLTWPRQIPLDGEPAEVVKIVSDYSQWLAHSQVPKLYFQTAPGALDHGRQREFCRTWPDQTEVAVKGIHFVQEDSPTEIGAAVASFVRTLRRLQLDKSKLTGRILET